MHHKLLTQRALFCIGVNAKKDTLSQHSVTHVVPPGSALWFVGWGLYCLTINSALLVGGVGLMTVSPSALPFGLGCMGLMTVSP